MNSPLITWIVPVYKVEYGQLKRCINSILSQKYSAGQLEVILIDDGSPDECGAICDSYAENQPEIKVIHQKNQGLAVVRNVGVDNALGEWVGFIDGDDWIEADTFTQAEKLLRNVPQDTDIVLWDGFAEYENGSKYIRFFDTKETDLKVFPINSKEQVIDRMLPRYVNKADISRCASLGVTWARLYRRSMLIENNVKNIPGLRLMQDSVFNLWAVEYARTICYKNMALYHYSVYDTSISKKQDPTAADSVLQLYHHYEDYINNCHNTEDFRQRLYVRTVRMLVKCLSKDYANPSNKASLRERTAKMKKDIECVEFQTALKEMDASGQEFKLRVIHFLLKHHFYRLSILVSYGFGKFRSVLH